MENNGMMLPVGILLLGLACVTGFMAFRPWPVGTSSNPVKPGAYFVEILQGNPPAASTPPDRQADITIIEGGLATILGIWAISKIAGAAGNLFPGGSGESGDEGEEGGEGEIGEIEGDIGDIVGDLGDV